MKLSLVEVSLSVILVFILPIKYLIMTILSFKYRQNVTLFKKDLIEMINNSSNLQETRNHPLFKQVDTIHLRLI